MASSSVFGANGKQRRKGFYPDQLRLHTIITDRSITHLQLNSFLYFSYPNGIQLRSQNNNTLPSLSRSFIHIRSQLQLLCVLFLIVLWFYWFFIITIFMMAVNGHRQCWRKPKCSRLSISLQFFFVLSIGNTSFAVIFIQSDYYSRDFLLANHL